MDGFSFIIRFLKDGGFFMYPIALTLFFGIAIAIERFVFLSRIHSNNRRSLKIILPLLMTRDYQKLLDATKKIKSPSASLTTAALKRLQHSTDYQGLESVIEEQIMEATPLLEKRTPYLATLANIATLTGLLGTVIGLIAAFNAVALASSSEKASLLSESISIAMNTTAFGLIVAIPLLLIHSIIQSKSSSILDSLDILGLKILNVLTETKN